MVFEDTGLARWKWETQVWEIIFGSPVSRNLHLCVFHSESHLLDFLVLFQSGSSSSCNMAVCLLRTWLESQSEEVQSLGFTSRQSQKCTHLFRATSAPLSLGLRPLSSHRLVQALWIPSPLHSANCCSSGPFINTVTSYWRLLRGSSPLSAVSICALTQPFSPGPYPPSHLSSSYVRWPVVPRMCHAFLTPRPLCIVFPLLRPFSTSVLPCHLF